MQSKLLNRLEGQRSRPKTGRLDSFAIQRMILALRIQDSHVHVRATRNLIKAGLDAVPQLIQALDDPNPQVWRLASVALLKIGDPAVPHLIAALEHQHECVRMYSAAILYKLGKPEPFEPGWERMRQEYHRLMAHQQPGSARTQ